LTFSELIAGSTVNHCAILYFLFFLKFEYCIIRRPALQGTMLGNDELFKTVPESSELGIG